MIGELRCVRCDLLGRLGPDARAEYIYNGESLCRIHFLNVTDHVLDAEVLR